MVLRYVLSPTFCHGNLYRCGTRLHTIKRPSRTKSSQPSIPCSAPSALHSTANITNVRPIVSNDLSHGACRHKRTSRSKSTSNKRPTLASMLFGRANKTKFRRPWHDPTFMQDSSPAEVEKWLLHLIQSAKRRGDSSLDSISYFDKDFVLDATAYLRVLEAYARSKTADSPQKAEYWIGILERHHLAASELFSATYQVDVGGRATAGGRDAIPTTRHTTDFASLRARSQGASNKTTPTSPVHARHTEKQASDDDVQRAAAIVRSLRPTVECYNTIIDSWAHDKNPISIVRSRRWLTKLEDEAKKTNHHSLEADEITPNARSYDLYLQSCSRGLGKQAKLHKERAEECERILEYRLGPDAPLEIRPTTESFNYVLRAWTRCRKEISVAGNVMDLVLRMERMQKDFLLAEEKGMSVGEPDESWKGNIAPDTKSYTMALDGWIIKAGLKADKWRSKQLAIMNIAKQRARRREKNEGPQVKSMSGDGGGTDDGTKEMEKAETLLKYIQDLDSIGHADVRATVIAYNILLSGWARLANEIRHDVPLKSERLLHGMIALAEDGNENAAPDATSFNAVIKAWGRTKRANSADRCEYWLRKMIHENCSTNSYYQREKNFTPKPNVQTYNLVMDAHFQLGDAARVQDMLIEMDGTNGHIPPNSESFSKVIRAWLNDELQEQQYGLPGMSVENAWRWLDELTQREKRGEENLGSAPDLFSSILKTAARTSARGENMLLVGRKAFWTMKASRFPPDSSLPYTWFLEIILKVLPSKKDDSRREEFITSLFEQCCKDGFLSSKFVRKLSPFSQGPFHDDGWTIEESERICEKFFDRPPSFPAAWSRNLKPGQEYPPKVSDLVKNKI